MTRRRLFVAVLVLELLLLAWVVYLHWREWGNDAVLLLVVLVPAGLGVAKLLAKPAPPPIAIAALGVLGMVLAVVGGAHLSGSMAFQTVALQAVAFWVVIWRRFKSVSQHDA